MTATAAAGPETESVSWPESPSLGRCTGSIYTSAVLEILAKEVSPAKDDTETKDSKTYQELADDITAKLLLLDRFGACHDIEFSAQDDDWTRDYHERTEIPLAVYKERLEKLKTIPSTDISAHPFGDRTTDKQLQERGLPPNPSPSLTTSLRGRCGGSARAVEAVMKKRVLRYQQSHPGPPEAAPNHTIYALMRRCLRGECSFEDLGRLETMLDYRENIDKFVGTLIVVMGLKPFPPPHEWDPAIWVDRSALHRSTWWNVFNSHLIPKPLPNQGRSNKPFQYLTAAFLAHQLDEAEVARRLEIAKKCKPIASGGLDSGIKTQN